MISKFRSWNLSLERITLLKRQAPKKQRRFRPKQNGPQRWTLPDLDRSLEQKSDLLQCVYLNEPTLVFAGKQVCEDPKTGLTAAGPYSKTDSTRREQVRIGIVGPADAVDRAVQFLSRLSRPIEQSGKTDAVLHPSFPGLNHGEPFQIEIVTQHVWHRTLKRKDIVQILDTDDFTERVGLLTAAVVAEVRALYKLDPRPDVVICAMSEDIEEACRVGIAKHDAEKKVEENQIDEDIQELIGDSTEDDDESDEVDTEAARSFRRGLKAGCLNLLPTQLIWHRTLAGTKGVQDAATRAWNLSVALLYKAGVVPWRLSETIDGTCFVGISFFHKDKARSAILRTSVAQAFSERGEGFVLEGDEFSWDENNEFERTPHLSRIQSRKLLERVLKVYREQLNIPPRKVVIHKTSKYIDEEIEGFQDALSDVPQYAMVTINRRGIYCFRPGNRPVLRGTLVDFGGKAGLVFTTGYVPFLRCYPGLRIPHALEITENWGSLTLHEVAEDILKLTKLNWNSAAFYCRDPITIAFAQKVGDILKMSKVQNPAVQYRFYM
jgi:hypothetical protein